MRIETFSGTAKNNLHRYILLASDIRLPKIPAEVINAASLRSKQRLVAALNKLKPPSAES